MSKADRHRPESRGLNARSERILWSIVQTYVETGQPVASADISRLRRHGLSSASIRNIMAELAAEGYLHQPHTSAGRVPTEKAFQAFVSALPGRRVQHDEVGRIRDALQEAGSVEERMQHCSRLLSTMTDSVAFTATMPESRVLDQVQLVSLGDRRVLMVVVTSDKVVNDQVVMLDEPVNQDELNSIRNYINVEFSGWSIADVQRELRLRMEAASAAYDLILKKLILLYDKGLFEVGAEPEVRIDGAANLFELRLTRERLRDLFRALEEKKRIVQLLDRFLEQPSGEVGVYVGLGSAHPSMGELALIGIRVGSRSGMAAKFAVLGPMRMDYPRAMSAVLHVGRAFGSFLS
jgi:heat-inducible transcriptional repressor